MRAARRVRELRARGEEADEKAVLADLLRRDERNFRRTAAPLKAAPDAHLLDTTHYGIDATFRAAVQIIEAARTRPKARSTALSSLEVKPVRRFACAAPDKALSRSYGLGPNRRLPGGCCAFRDHFHSRGSEYSWLKLLRPRPRARTSPG